MALGVYNNVRLKLLPKRISYSLSRIIVGSMVIAIEINKNLASNKRNFGPILRAKRNMLAKAELSTRTTLTERISYKNEGKEPRSIVTMLKECLYVKRTIPRNITGIEILKKKTLLDRSRF